MESRHNDHTTERLGLERSWEIGTLALDMWTVSHREHENALRCLLRAQNVNCMPKCMASLVEISFKVLFKNRYVVHSG